MVIAPLAYAAISAVRPYGITPAAVEAIGLSLVAVPVVFLGALVTGGFPFREYEDLRHCRGRPRDPRRLFATLLTTRSVQWFDLGGTPRLVVLGMVGYFTAFGVFSARNLSYYVPDR